MPVTRLLWRADLDTGGFIAGSRRMVQSTEQVGSSMSRVSGVGVAGMVAGLTAAVALMDQLLDRAHELDRVSLQTTISAELLGGGRPEALAVSAVGEPFGVGPQQYFDAAEAVRDALVNKTGESGESAQAAAAAIGLDRDRFLDPALSNFERTNQLLDTLIAFEGDVGELLQAASELGAGDVRDLVELAGVVSAAPQYHPRAVAALIEERGAHISDAQAQANAQDYIRRNLQQLVGDELLSGQDIGSADNLLSSLPIVGDNYARAVAAGALAPPDPDRGRRALAEHFGVDPASAGIAPAPQTRVEIEIVDSTVGGIRAAKRVSDAQSDGRTATDALERTPAR